jgi:hypothetical protein
MSSYTFTQTSSGKYYSISINSRMNNYNRNLRSLIERLSVANSQSNLSDVRTVSRHQQDVECSRFDDFTTYMQFIYKLRVSDNYFIDQQSYLEGKGP